MKIRNIIDMLLNVFRLSAYTLQDKIENYLDKGLRYINKIEGPRYIKSEECKEIKDMYLDDLDLDEENETLDIERNRYGFPKH
jgi:hypothetical protein|tara:strand:- start:93 stop:341 length:249 start_codon:yes stop_codon:yes gene_type:complete